MNLKAKGKGEPLSMPCLRFISIAFVSNEIKLIIMQKFILLNQIMKEKKRKGSVVLVKVSVYLFCQGADVDLSV